MLEASSVWTALINAAAGGAPCEAHSCSGLVVRIMHNAVYVMRSILAVVTLIKTWRPDLSGDLAFDYPAG